MTSAAPSSALSVTPGLQNDLLLRALQGQEVPRPPVWMMRQAGRFLPDFRALRHQYSFFTRVETPELATKITLMPVEQVGVDAAILFSDILVIPQALGFEVTMNEGEGPRFPRRIERVADVEAIAPVDAEAKLHYVMAAIRQIRQELNGRVPLIGFAGAPWTLLCYMVEGSGSKEFAKAKAFCYAEPKAAHALLQKITDATVDYLNAQIRNGAQAVQVFDTWAGQLNPADFATFSLPYLQQIMERVQGAPRILFAKDAWHSLDKLKATGANALGVDWHTPASFARQQAPGITLQGNFDPSLLYAPIPEIRKRAHAMIQEFGPQRYVANLGHGILPDVPVDHAKAFVQAIQSWPNP